MSNAICVIKLFCSVDSGYMTNFRETENEKQKRLKVNS